MCIRDSYESERIGRFAREDELFQLLFNTSHYYILIQMSVAQIKQTPDLQTCSSSLFWCSFQIHHLVIHRNPYLRCRHLRHPKKHYHPETLLNHSTWKETVKNVSQNFFGPTNSNVKQGIEGSFNGYLNPDPYQIYVYKPNICLRFNLFAR